MANIAMKDLHPLVAVFVSRRPDYERAAQRVYDACRTLCSQLGFHDAVVTRRTKEMTSLADKLKSKSYNSLEEIPDLAGVRVILDDKTQVTSFTGAVVRDFLLRWPHTTIRRLHIDQVGYVARHFVVQSPIADNWHMIEQPERLNCELQVRTLLQHAWAQTQRTFAIYKAEASAPRRLRRKLNIVAGALEIIDSEIERARGELSILNSAEEQVLPFEEPLTANSLRDLSSHPFMAYFCLESGNVNIADDVTKMNSLQLEGAVEVLANFNVNSLGQVTQAVFDSLGLVLEALSWLPPLKISDPVMLMMLATVASGIDDRLGIIERIPQLDDETKRQLRLRLTALAPNLF